MITNLANARRLFADGIVMLSLPCRTTGQYTKPMPVQNGKYTMASTLCQVHDDVFTAVHLSSSLIIFWSFVFFLCLSNNFRWPRQICSANKTVRGSPPPMIGFWHRFCRICGMEFNRTASDSNVSAIRSIAWKAHKYRRVLSGSLAVHRVCSGGC